MQINDISKHGGGRFCHHNHQNGLEADIRYVRNDGKEDAVDAFEPGFSYPLSRMLINVFRAGPDLVTIIGSDNRDPDGQSLSGVKQDKDDIHDDHFHVEFRDPDGLNN